MPAKIEQKEHFHGSDLEKIEALYGIKKEDIISFSANVNPLGVSFRLRETLSQHIDAITSYPDREYTSLRRAIAAYLSAEPEHILVGSGATELISNVIQIRKPKHALIVGPTYSEYEREIALSGGQSRYFLLPEENNFSLSVPALLNELAPVDGLAQAGGSMQKADFLVLCNPNNPTSSAISRREIREILNFCRERDIFVMIDETYVEFAENMDEITAVPLSREYNNIIILRGVSKFFAAPGLRLGYAVCGSTALLDEINQKKNPWMINSLAAIAGEIMFSDEEYKQQTRKLIAKERTRVCAELAKLPAYKVYPPTANFVLVRIEKAGLTAPMLFDAAIRKGLMLRDCSTFASLDERYFRFCFMKPEDNDALLAVLRDCC